MKEIERKFLLKSLPMEAIAWGMRFSVKQGYLYVGRGELRIRKIGKVCYLTVKSGGTITRFEWEIKIPGWIFNFLWPVTRGRRVEKTRYVLMHGDKKLEIDRYYWDLNGLFTLECEFASEEAARAFVLPAWIKDAKDISDDKRYKNKNLAVDGLPI